MASDPEQTSRDGARASLKQMQDFNPESLPRENELGSSFHFKETVEPARRLLELYGRLSLSALDDLPQQQLDQITAHANRDFSYLDQILKFDPKQVNATQSHQSAITSLRTAYHGTFSLLHPFISYSLHKTADFRRLAGEAQETLEAIRKQADEATEGLREHEKAAGRILDDVRKAAAEGGVTQQAIYFQKSAANHDREAHNWQKRTVGVAIGLGVYAFTTLFFHKIPWLTPADSYQTVQIAVSKVLVFSVIAYMLYLCARNMLSHKHNSIIDRHRQNALMTYKAIVEAAGDTPNREVILVQAAACIFAPQVTGYSHDSAPPPPGAHSVVEFISKPLRGGE